MGATDLPEVLETVPGLHATIQPVTNDYSYSIRGIRNDTNAEVLLMMNGTRFSIPYQGTHMAGMIIPVENIQRVEVIRGPGSALYGADAFAGVINIVTKKAADLDGVTIGARGGNADTKSAWGQYGGQWQGWDVASSLQYSHNGIDPDRIVSSDAQTQVDAALNTHASLAPGPMQTQNERWNGHLNLQRKHWDLGFWAFNESDFGFRAGTAGALDNRGKGNGSNYLGDVRFSTEDDLEDWELQAHASFLHTDIIADIYNFPVGTILPIDANGNPTVQTALTRTDPWPGPIS
jgi:iron complex outermembrane receptor protein